MNKAWTVPAALLLCWFQGGDLNESKNDGSDGEAAADGSDVEDEEKGEGDDDHDTSGSKRGRDEDDEDEDDDVSTAVECWYIEKFCSLDLCSPYCYLWTKWNLWLMNFPDDLFKYYISN